MTERTGTVGTYEMYNRTLPGALVGNDELNVWVARLNMLHAALLDVDCQFLAMELNVLINEIRAVVDKVEAIE